MKSMLKDMECMSSRSDGVGKRDTKIDLIKGLFIFLVVLGHLIRGETSNGINPYGILHFFIYTIHMPAFIFISGILSQKLSNTNALLKQLIIPYIIINVPILLVRIAMHRFEPLDLITPWEITWYLLTLFGCRLLIKISESKQPVIIALAIIVSVAGTLVPKNLWLIGSIGRTLLLYPLFYIGKNIKLETMKSIPKRIGYYLILFAFCTQLFIPAITQNVTITWASHDYPNSVIEVFEKYVFFIAAIAMVLGLYAVLPTSKQHCGGIYTTFERYGRNSMVIYLFHIFACYSIQHFISFFPDIYFLVVLLLAWGITEVLSLDVFLERYTSITTFHLFFPRYLFSCCIITGLGDYRSAFSGCISREIYKHYKKDGKDFSIGVINLLRNLNAPENLKENITCDEERKHVGSYGTEVFFNGMDKDANVDESKFVEKYFYKIERQLALK